MFRDTATCYWQHILFPLFCPVALNLFALHEVKSANPDIVSRRLEITTKSVRLSIPPPPPKQLNSINKSSRRYYESFSDSFVNNPAKV
jgi:hypothetical protein